ncbi:transmembrane protein 87A-like [Glandiceps talaboti]
MAKLGIVVLSFIVTGCFCYPEQGKFEAVLSKDDRYVGFPKSMFKGSKIKLMVKCTGENTENKEFTVSWMLRWTPCSENYMYLDSNLYATYFEYPDTVSPNEDLFMRKMSAEPYVGKCGETHVLPDESKSGSVIKVTPEPPPSNKTATGSKEKLDQQSEETKDTKDTERRKREEGGDDKDAETADTEAKETEDADKKITDDTNNVEKNPDSDDAAEVEERSTKATLHSSEKNSHVVTTTWTEGMYLFIVEVTPDSGADMQITVNVEVESKTGYISAVDYPLLIFYGVMCIVYCLYAIMWLCCSACQWRDLLRIQFWIGGVILLGLLEKAVFYGEYQHINSNGDSVSGAVVFAELVSCLKRTLARMLVIIVSLGFGIVKPRLGPMLHRVLGVGALYFILGAIEGCLRSLRPKQDPSKQALLAGIPLAVLDAAICWWIFTSLVQTTRTLRLRRNVVKLSLYRHFTNTLIFSVVAALIFMVWSIKAHRFTDCLTDWKELWIDEAYWHLLFCLVLMVIMVLWRPTANNQRYAFSPLTDLAEEEGDEESKEPMMNDAFEGMKMRGVGGKSNGSPRVHITPDSKAEADLKWVEENIPQSVADAALPSLLDSDEEIMTTKFEMSKME